MNSIIKVLLIGIILVSCKKEDPPADSGSPVLSNGLLVANEGLFQNNNASLTFFSFEEQLAYQNFFQNENNESLGDVANDMKIYGGKIYIVMNNSHLIHVLDAKTGNSIAKISLMNGGVGRSPRSIDFFENKAYVCSYDGSLVKIDTGTFSIESVITLGRNPEFIARVGTKLYVTNSGGLDFPDYDSTVSVVDIPSFTEIKRISVGINPGEILADDDGDLYVISRGNYASVPSRMFKIDSSIDSVVFELTGVDVNGIEYAEHKLYYSYQDISGGTPVLGIFNTQTEAIENSSLMDLSNMNTLYGVCADPSRQKLYLMEANNYSSTGDVMVYGMDGVFQNSFGVGYLPSKILIIN